MTTDRKPDSQSVPKMDANEERRLRNQVTALEDLYTKKVQEHVELRMIAARLLDALPSCVKCHRAASRVWGAGSDVEELRCSRHDKGYGKPVVYAGALEEMVGVIIGTDDEDFEDL